MAKVLSFSSPLKLLSLVRNLDDGTYFLDVEFLRHDGCSDRTLVPREYFATPHLIVRRLLSLGAVLPTGRGAATGLVRTTLTPSPPTEYAVTNATGWIPGESFVLPDVTIGPAAGNVRFAGTGTATHDLTKGSISEWRDGLRLACAASSFLTMTIATGFAGTLLEVTEQFEGAAFHLTGESATGKTLCELAALSVSRRAERCNLLTHDATERGLEEACAAANDLTLVVDEVARLSGGPSRLRTRLRELAHRLASGQGRRRSAKATSDPNLRNISFLLMAISSGELPIEDGSGDRGRERGVQVRFIELLIPPLQNGGIFDRLPTGQSALVLAQTAEDCIAHNYGHAIRIFLEKFITDYDRNVDRARLFLDHFIDHVGAGSDPWDRRFAAKFGVVYAAAKLAAEFEVAPWNSRCPRKCIQRLYQNARTLVRTPSEAADDLVRRLTKFSRSRRKFPLVKKGEAVPPGLVDDAWGIRRRDSSGDLILALVRDRLDDLVRPHFHAGAVLPILESRGLLIPGKEAGRYVRQIAVQGMRENPRPDFVCFRRERLDALRSYIGDGDPKVTRQATGRSD